MEKGLILFNQKQRGSDEQQTTENQDQVESTNESFSGHDKSRRSTRTENPGRPGSHSRNPRPPGLLR